MEAKEGITNMFRSSGIVTSDHIGHGYFDNILDETSCKLLLFALCVTFTVAGIIMTDYGPCWREHRRFALMTLRNFGLGKNSMEERIHEETKYIVNTLEKSVGEDNSNHKHRYQVPRSRSYNNVIKSNLCQQSFPTIVL